VGVLLVLLHIMDFVVLAAGAELLGAGPLKKKSSGQEPKINSIFGTKIDTWSHILGNIRMLAASYVKNPRQNRWMML
jgi:hypothetical protein